MSTADRADDSNASNTPLQRTTPGDAEATPADSRGDFLAWPDPADETGSWSTEGTDCRGGRFTIQGVHAKGGLGVVSKAFDHELRRTVAIKEIRTDRRSGGTITRRRFIQEAVITAALGHPGIVPIYSMGREPDGSPYYAMRLYEGSDLRQELAQFYRDPANQGINPTHSLRFRQLLNRFVQVCKTIAYAHGRGVIHRDLKPANIMLGSFGETLVLDWGLAKPIDGKAGSSATPAATGSIPNPVRLSKEDSADETEMGQELGTPEYMSPEQARGDLRQVGIATDVFGLGATLYSILTGVAPIRESTKEEKLARARSGDFSRPREINRHLPAALDAICMKAMAPEIEHRYASALELADDVEKWLADEPVTAFREPWLASVRRQVRRHPTATSLAVACLAFLAIGSTLYTRVVRAQRDQIVAANRLTEDALTKARASYEVAEDMIEQFGIKMGDDAWAQIPQFEPLRLDTVALAVENRRKLAELTDNDPLAQARIAESLRHWANLYRSMNRFDRAEPPMAEATQIAESLVQQHPSNPKYASLLISIRGDALDLSIRVHGSVSSAELLETLLRELAAFQQQFPQDHLVRLYSAFAATTCAKVLRDLDRHPEAIRLLEPTTRMMSLVADNQPADQTSGLVSSISWLLLAEIARDDEQWPIAEIASLEASRRVERMLNRDPSDVHAQDLEGMRLNAEAFWAIERTQDHAAATQLNESAIALWEGLEAEQSESANRRVRLAEALTTRAEVRRAAGELNLARQDVERAVRLLNQLARESDQAARYAESRGLAFARQFVILQDLADPRADAARESAISELSRARDAAPGNRVVSRWLTRLELER